MLHYDPALDKWEKLAPTSTLESLRKPSQYWIISDAQLKRDLRGRTIADVYRENRAGRSQSCKRRDYNDDKAKYEAWCKSKGHVPHPASLDAEHKHNVHRLKLPRMERS